MKEKNILSTQLYTSSYFSNNTKFGMIQKKDDGSFLLDWHVTDDCEIVGFAVEQTGLWARVAFKDPAQWIGLFPPQPVLPDTYVTY